MTLQNLRKHYLFSILDDKQFNQILSGIQAIELNENNQLFYFEERARYFYFLASGQIQLYRTSPNGEEKVIEIIQAGQTFAEAVMFFSSNRYPVSAKAVLNSQLLQIEMKQFSGLLRESNELCIRLLGGLSKRLHSAIEEIDRLTLHNASVRVIQFLLQNAPDFLKDNQYSFYLDTPKLLLASRLSVKPETLSRILKQLSNKNLISVQRRTIFVLDYRNLQLELSED
ncbi:Crp/Fnr family transcriptional regulator [Methylomarinum vadi]|uniref:Crp/Fnr family transcriptional regulator n=1 Tax=Methylomarinum vadi TaxID=438855 RepID=UPI0004DFB1B0|nr:Crp/Fnr family transcriptional regulator [Methylomarinum vadi]